MEYIYCSLLLHKLGKEVNEENLKKVIEATGIESDDAKIKAVVSSLKDVDIDEAVKVAAQTPVAAAPAQEAASEGDKKEEKKEEKEEEKKPESGAAGLANLFS